MYPVAATACLPRDPAHCWWAAFGVPSPVNGTSIVVRGRQVRHISDSSLNIDENAILMIRGAGADGAPPAAGVRPSQTPWQGIYRATVRAWRRIRRTTITEPAPAADVMTNQGDLYERHCSREHQ